MIYEQIMADAACGYGDRRPHHAQGRWSWVSPDHNDCVAAAGAHQAPSAPHRSPHAAPAGVCGDVAAYVCWWRMLWNRATAPIPIVRNNNGVNVNLTLVEAVGQGRCSYGSHDELDVVVSRKATGPLAASSTLSSFARSLPWSLGRRFLREGK